MIVFLSSSLVPYCSDMLIGLLSGVYMVNNDLNDLLAVNGLLERAILAHCYAGFFVVQSGHIWRDLERQQLLER